MTLGKGWEYSFFEDDSKQGLIEAWFDEHPEPWNIDMHSFEFENCEVEVFFADVIYDIWMVKITCNNARRATFLSKLYYKTTSQMDIEQVLIGKKLFFLKY
jgi:hypothetical protein